jgi:MOSC domain-containing protein YiiM
MMAEARLVAVCVGSLVPLSAGGAVAGSAGIAGQESDPPGSLSGIDKRACAGPVEVGRLGLAGDAQAERPIHGGLDRALYAYGETDADHWVATLQTALPPGSFGENLRVAGLEVSRARLGERWRLGEHVVVEVTAPRLPCEKLATFLGVPDMIERFLAAERPGAYLRVLVGGHLVAGDRVRVVRRTDAPTVAQVMAWRRGRIPTAEAQRLAQDPALAADLVGWAREVLADR